MQEEFELQFYEGILSKKPDHVEALTLLAEVYTSRKEYKKGLDLDKRLAALKPEDPIVRYNLACSLNLTSAKKEALSELRWAIHFGYDDYQHLLQDKDLKSLHGEEEFQVIVKSLKPQRGASNG